MRPPSAVEFNFGKGKFRNRGSAKFGAQILDNVAVRRGDEGISPEGEIPFRAYPVCREDEYPVRDGVTAHHGHPTVLLSFVEAFRFAAVPTDCRRIDQDIRTFERFDAGRFGKPLVPADKDAKLPGGSGNRCKSRVARGEVVLFEKSRIVGDMALAVNPGDASVPLEDECAVVVDSAGAFLEKGEYDNASCFPRYILPFANNGVVLFDGAVETFFAFFDRKVGCMAKFGQNQDIDFRFLQFAGFAEIPGVCRLGVSEPFSLENCRADIFHGKKSRKHPRAFFGFSNLYSVKNRIPLAFAAFLFCVWFFAGCVSSSSKGTLPERSPAKDGTFWLVIDSVAPNAEIRRVPVKNSASLPTRAALDFSMYFKNPIREAGKLELSEGVAAVELPKGDLPFPMFDSVAFSMPEVLSGTLPVAWEPFTKYLFASGGGDSLAAKIRSVESVKWGRTDIFADFQKVEALWFVNDLTGASFWAEVHPRKWTGVSPFWGRLRYRPTETESKAFLSYTSDTLSLEASLDWARTLAAYLYPSLNTDLEPVPPEGSWFGRSPFVVMRGNPMGTPLWVALDVPAFRNVRTQDSLKSDSGEFVRKPDTSSFWRRKTLESLQGACQETPGTKAFKAKLSAVLDSLPSGQNAWASEGMLWFRRDANSLLAEDFTAQDSLHNPLPRLLELKSELDSQNIQFLVVPIPTKESVYAYKLIQGTSDTLCVDVAGRAFIRKMLESGLDVLDVFPVLLDARSSDGENGFAFQKNDTHWSLTGLLSVMELLAERVTAYDWYVASGARPGALELRDTTILREGDLVAQLPKSEQGFYFPETLEVKKVYRDGKPYRGDRNSPILLMGDSFTGVFESIDGKSGGPGSLLAFATGLDVQTITSWGGGPGVRHRVMKDKKTLQTKRLVIYMMTMRDFYASPMEWDALQ